MASPLSLETVSPKPLSCLLPIQKHCLSSFVCSLFGFSRLQTIILFSVKTVLIVICRVPCVPQGKLGGCTVISQGVNLNYTTYYLNLGASQGRTPELQALSGYQLSFKINYNQYLRFVVMISSGGIHFFSEEQWALQSKEITFFP